MKTVHSPIMTEYAKSEKAFTSQKNRAIRKRVIEIALFVASCICASSLFAQNTYSALILKNQNADISTLKNPTSFYEAGVATIKWTVENEKKFCVYVVEKSTDGETYIPFGKVIRRETDTRSSYSYTDTKPYSGKGYYRLLVVYGNGAYDYADAGTINDQVTESVSGGAPEATEPK